MDQRQHNPRINTWFLVSMRGLCYVSGDYNALAEEYKLIKTEA